MTDVLPYRTMAYNNAWANHRLLTACLGLTPEEFTAKRTGFFPSLRATLNHILIIDHFYVDAMEGGTLGPAAWADQEPCATVAALKEAQAAVDRRLLKVVEALDGAGSAAHRLRASRHLHPARTDGPLAAASVPARRAPPRAGARDALSATSVSPPQLDEFFAVGEAPLRAVEFAELGLDRGEDLGRVGHQDRATVARMSNLSSRSSRSVGGSDIRDDGRPTQSMAAEFETPLHFGSRHLSARRAP